MIATEAKTLSKLLSSVIVVNISDSSDPKLKFVSGISTWKYGTLSLSLISSNYNYPKVGTTQDLKRELGLWYPHLRPVETVSQAENLNSEGEGVVQREEQTSEQTGRHYQVVG